MDFKESKKILNNNGYILIEAAFTGDSFDDEEAFREYYAFDLNTFKPLVNSPEVKSIDFDLEDISYDNWSKTYSMTGKLKVVFKDPNLGEDEINQILDSMVERIEKIKPHNDYSYTSKIDTVYYDDLFVDKKTNDLYSIIYMTCRLS